ncbi:MAG: hypothetical protein R3C14_47525 [Caldilineaceae bacterium]
MTESTFELASQLAESPTYPEAPFVAAGQWRLIWRKFRKHRLALWGGGITVVIYLIAIFAEFIAPFTPDRYGADYTYAPPQRLHLWQQGAAGWRFRPYVNGYKVEINYEQGRRVFVVDPEVQYAVDFFVTGEPYQLLGLFTSDIHLIGPVDPNAPMFLTGADRLGRDIFSRTIYGTRISMTIGLVGDFQNVTHFSKLLIHFMLAALVCVAALLLHSSVLG